LSNWLDELRQKFNELSHTVAGLAPERLSRDEAFSSAFAHATQAAMRSYRAEKLEALRSAVLNIAIGRAPAEDLQLIFLNLIDRFTPTHLQTLAFLAERQNAHTFLAQCRSHRELSDLVGLLKDTRPYVARNRETSDILLMEPWQVTDLGGQFLAFIKSPTGPTDEG
jgi:hypothetical protein